MIISHIETPFYNYFNLHAEEVISSNYLNDDNEGIYISSLQFETVNRLFNYIKKIDFKSQNNIVLDFNHIEHLQPNILKKVIEIRELKFKLTFLNVSSNIIEALSLENIVNTKNLKNVKNGFDIFYFFTDINSDLYDVEIKNYKIFEDEFKKVLKDKN
jgi:hypothetical protein